MKIGFLLGILILVALTAITTEATTTLSNCLAVCSDSAGCTCPNYCTISGTVSNNENCGGEVTTCSQENRRYWVRDNDCQSTCGDFDNNFMTSKGWERVDYNCYTNEKTPVIEEKNKTGEIIQETPEETTQETNKTTSGNFLIYSAVGLAVIVIALITWFILKRKKR